MVVLLNRRQVVNTFTGKYYRLLPLHNRLKVNTADCGSWVTDRVWPSFYFRVSFRHGLWPALLILIRYAHQITVSKYLVLCEIDLKISVIYIILVITSKLFRDLHCCGNFRTWMFNVHNCFCQNASNLREFVYF